jgi:hypothetical protein
VSGSSRSTRPRSTTCPSATGGRRLSSRSACCGPARPCGCTASRRRTPWTGTDGCSATWSAPETGSTSTSSSCGREQRRRTSSTTGADDTRPSWCGWRAAHAHGAWACVGPLPRHAVGPEPRRLDRAAAIVRRRVARSPPGARPGGRESARSTPSGTVPVRSRGDACRRSPAPWRSGARCAEERSRRTLHRVSAV